MAKAIGVFIAGLIALAIRIALGATAVYLVVNLITGTYGLGFFEAVSVFCGLDVLQFLLLSKQRGVESA